jgi:hypothetical protein
MSVSLVLRSTLAVLQGREKNTSNVRKLFICHRTGLHEEKPDLVRCSAISPLSVSRLVCLKNKIESESEDRGNLRMQKAPQAGASPANAAVPPQYQGGQVSTGKMMARLKKNSEQIPSHNCLLFSLEQGANQLVIALHSVGV